MARGSEIGDGDQMDLPFFAGIKSTIVQLVDVTATFSQRILSNPAELLSLTPPQFESFVLDRLSAMDLEVYPVGGHTYGRDGGIDIIFTPRRGFPFPFLGAAQVKHHRDPSKKVGPAPVRELGGVVAAQKFSAGLIVTNTSFTPDAKSFADESRALLRLRDFKDLMRWVRDNFADDAEWREMPRRITVCPGVVININ